MVSRTMARLSLDKFREMASIQFSHSRSMRRTKKNATMKTESEDSNFSPNPAVMDRIREALLDTSSFPGRVKP